MLIIIGLSFPNFLVKMYFVNVGDIFSIDYSSTDLCYLNFCGIGGEKGQNKLIDFLKKIPKDLPIMMSWSLIRRAKKDTAKRMQAHFNLTLVSERSGEFVTYFVTPRLYFNINNISALQYKCTSEEKKKPNLNYENHSSSRHIVKILDLKGANQKQYIGIRFRIITGKWKDNIGTLCGYNGSNTKFKLLNTSEEKLITNTNFVEFI